MWRHVCGRGRLPTLTATAYAAPKRTWKLLIRTARAVPGLAPDRLAASYADGHRAQVIVQAAADLAAEREA